MLAVPPSTYLRKVTMKGTVIHESKSNLLSLHQMQRYISDPSYEHSLDEIELECTVSYE